MKCKCCGCELAEYCITCQEKRLSETIAKVQEEHGRTAKHFHLIPEEKYDELKEQGLL